MKNYLKKKAFFINFDHFGGYFIIVLKMVLKVLFRRQFRMVLNIIAKLLLFTTIIGGRQILIILVLLVVFNI